METRKTLAQAVADKHFNDKKVDQLATKVKIMETRKTLAQAVADKHFNDKKVDQLATKVKIADDMEKMLLESADKLEAMADQFGTGSELLSNAYENQDVDRVEELVAVIDAIYEAMPKEVLELPKHIGLTKKSKKANGKELLGL